MKLTGYSDIWSVRPGEEIGFCVHCEAPEFSAALVRLIHGDTSALGPGARSERVPSSADGRHPGGARRIVKGSWGTAPLPDLSAMDGALGLSAWIWPTLPGPTRQGILGWHDGAGRGLSLLLDPDHHVVCRAGTVEVRCPVPLVTREWYRIEVTSTQTEVVLTVTADRWQPAFDTPIVARAEAAGPVAPMPGQSMLFAAGALRDGIPSDHFNGRLARPSALAAGTPVALWDLGLATDGWTLRDTCGDRHGQLFNGPARAMPGPDWPNGSLSTAAQPATHDAIHFHDDDVADVGWPESFRLRVPDDLPSGVYAMRLEVGECVDHLPFFVCPPRSGTRPRLAVLMPTMSYLAYANESLDVSDAPELSPRQDMSINRAAYAWVAENGLKSLYDRHRDGSNIILGTRRRPIIDFRPDTRCRTFDAPHQFAADLYLIDWLTHEGLEFDVITDDLLHDEGAGLLEPYRVVISGSHPEYWTAPMLKARDRWLDAGGRFMYLGGNGFYWVTGVSPATPDMIEVRRFTGTRTSSNHLGEETLATTGERGGLWRERGHPPHARMGIGFSGQGFDRGVPYRRAPASFEPDWRWIFAGVDSDILGAGRALVLGHGAAGFEVDRVSELYGTPAHTVVLASSQRFTNAYQGVIEERNSLDPWSGGSDPRSGIRSDIAITPGPRGGAVFSAGSITWSSTLSAEGYDSDTARITRNVMHRFLQDRPISGD